MRRMMLGVAALMLSAAPLAFGQQPTGQQASVGVATPPATFNVKVIVTAAFPNGINELRAKYELLTNEFKPQATQVQNLQQQIAGLENELQSQGQIMKPEVVSAKTSQHDRLQLELKQTQERAQADYQQRMQEVVGPMFEKIDKFLEAYAQQRGISLILDASNNQQNPILAFVGADADITQDFMTEYNRVNPGPAPTSTTPTTPKTTPATNPATKKPGSPGRP